MEVWTLCLAPSRWLCSTNSPSWTSWHSSTRSASYRYNHGPLGTSTHGEKSIFCMVFMDHVMLLQRDLPSGFIGLRGIRSSWIKWVAANLQPENRSIHINVMCNIVTHVSIKYNALKTYKVIYGIKWLQLPLPFWFFCVQYFCNHHFLLVYHFLFYLLLQLINVFIFTHG